MARQPTKVEVMAVGDKWDVREHGIGRLSSHATKQEAIQSARAIAAIHKPCELTIRNSDGTVTSEKT